MASVSSGAALPAGYVLNSTYKIEQYLGGGAYGDVYRVSHRFLGQQAMKLLRRDPLVPGTSQLLQEARVLVDLLHPNIVRIYDANEVVIESEPVAYLTMEFLSGGTLGQYRGKKIRLPIGHALSIAHQLLSGLAFAHNLRPPVLHRDITPNNIVIADVRDDCPIVKLADFGLAGRVHADTRILRAAGTIHYMPPEAAWGFMNEKSDVYAVALILYELLTGVAAFPSAQPLGHTTAAQVRDLIGSKKTLPPAPSRFRSDVVPEIDAVLLKALAPIPADRFATADQFGEAIGRISLRTS